MPNPQLDPQAMIDAKSETEVMDDAEDLCGNEHEAHALEVALVVGAVFRRALAGTRGCTACSKL